MLFLLCDLCASLRLFSSPNLSSMQRTAQYVCEETGGEVVLMKDRKGHVIGFERLNFPGKVAQPVRVAFETIPQRA